MTANGPGKLEQAAQTGLPVRLAEFTRWVADAPAGRKLTQTGRLTLGDARLLVQRLGTGDVIDPVIGDRTFRTKSSDELRGLSVTVEWARAAGLVRRRGITLVAVKKNAGLLNRPLELLTRMVEALGEIGASVCPRGWFQSILADDFAVGVEALLTAMDAGPDGVALDAVTDQLWVTLSALYRTEHLTEVQLERWRSMLARDVWITVELLAEAGLLGLDASPDREQRRAGKVTVTPLGRWVVRRVRGGPTEGEPVLQLRIELVDSADPPVWRRVLVPAACTLADLHTFIQAAMGWQNSHLHEFEVGDRRYGPKAADLDLTAGDGVRLDQVAAVGTMLAYRYDFGDDWEHQVTVEAQAPAAPGTRYPTCTGGQGACPPEDCGGIPGYEQLRETLADPDRTDHPDMLEWLGLDSAAGFDPARFEVRDAQLRLAACWGSARHR